MPPARPGLVLLSATLLLLSACGGADAQKGPGGPGGGRGTPTVGFVVASYADVPVTVSLAGRVVAAQTSEVRPQVAGILRRRLFTEGSVVRAGQPLYVVEDSLFRAAVNEAEANVASAHATAEAARARAARFRPLAEIEAVSRQEYDDARAQARQAEAAVAQNRARLDTARITLGFATVRAPISGRIGRSLVTEGALVSNNQGEPLAVIQQLDPVFVDMQQAGADLVALRRALATGTSGAGSAEVRLTLEDGSDYGPSGRLQFTEAVTNPATGTVTLRARFANAQGLLLPGMFVRARFAQSINRRAVRVPQQAVTRDEKGDALVWIVGPDGKVAQRPVTATRADGSDWVVTDGIAAGERIVTQGIANLRPGQAVKAVPESAPQRIAPPPAKDAAGAAKGSATAGPQR